MFLDFFLFYFDRWYVRLLASIRNTPFFNNFWLFDMKDSIIDQRMKYLQFRHTATFNKNFDVFNFSVLNKDSCHEFVQPLKTISIWWWEISEGQNDITLMPNIS